MKHKAAPVASSATWDHRLMGSRFTGRSFAFNAVQQNTTRAVSDQLFLDFLFKKKNIQILDMSLTQTVNWKIVGSETAMCFRPAYCPISVCCCRFSELVSWVGPRS